MMKSELTSTTSAMDVIVNTFLSAVMVRLFNDQLFE